MNSCKTKLPSFKIIGGIIFLLFTMFYVQAQTRTTNEAKVILVVSEKSDEISHLELFNTFEKMKGNEILEKYPNCQFYIGLLQGSYELNENDVIPLMGSTIIMYTDRHYLSGNRLLPSDSVFRWGPIGHGFDKGQSGIQEKRRINSKNTVR